MEVAVPVVAKVTSASMMAHMNARPAITILTGIIDIFFNHCCCSKKKSPESDLTDKAIGLSLCKFFYSCFAVFINQLPLQFKRHRFISLESN